MVDAEASEANRAQTEVIGAAHETRSAAWQEGEEAARLADRSSARANMAAARGGERSPRLRALRAVEDATERADRTDTATCWRDVGWWGGQKRTRLRVKICRPPWRET
jgi:hypothetical protein